MDWALGKSLQKTKTTVQHCKNLSKSKRKTVDACPPSSIGWLFRAIWQAEAQPGSRQPGSSQWIFIGEWRIQCLVKLAYKNATSPPYYRKDCVFQHLTIRYMRCLSSIICTFPPCVRGILRVYRKRLCYARARIMPTGRMLEHDKTMWTRPCGILKAGSLKWCSREGGNARALTTNNRKVSSFPAVSVRVPQQPMCHAAISLYFCREPASRSFSKFGTSGDPKLGVVFCEA